MIFLLECITIVFKCISQFTQVSTYTWAVYWCPSLDGYFDCTGCVYLCVLSVAVHQVAGKAGEGCLQVSFKELISRVLALQRKLLKTRESSVPLLAWFPTWSLLYIQLSVCSCVSMDTNYLQLNAVNFSLFNLLFISFCTAWN